jgi:uncharacterized protein with FMN-binding domain
MRTPTPLTLASLGLLGFVPTLTGCVNALETTSSEPAENAAVEEAPSEAPEAAAAPSANVYADGTYQAQGGYQSPNGAETIELTITITNNVVSEVLVTPNATDSSSKRYQELFAGGVGAETVGKPLDEISVSRISGSSLTSGGFAKALDSIKADART